MGPRVSSGQGGRQEPTRSNVPALLSDGHGRATSLSACCLSFSPSRGFKKTLPYVAKAIGHRK